MSEMIERVANARRAATPAPAGDEVERVAARIYASMKEAWAEDGEDDMPDWAGLLFRVENEDDEAIAIAGQCRRYALAVMPERGRVGAIVQDEAALEVRARQIAADKMHLVKDRTGANLPDDLWRQALPQARREFAEASALAAAEARGMMRAAGIAADQFHAFPTRSLAKEAIDCVIDAIKRAVALQPVEAVREDAPPLTFVYRNYQGDVAERRVIPISVRHGSSEWHPEPQWLMRALDVDKSAEREFAMRDIGAPRVVDNGAG